MPTQTLTESARSAAVTLRVVPRDQHPIWRKDISPIALRVLYRLREGSNQYFLVGCAVREMMVVGHPKVLDLVTSSTTEEVKQQLRNSRLTVRPFNQITGVRGKTGSVKLVPRG